MQASPALKDEAPGSGSEGWVKAAGGGLARGESGRAQKALRCPRPEGRGPGERVGAFVKAAFCGLAMGGIALTEMRGRPQRP